MSPLAPSWRESLEKAPKLSMPSRLTTVTSNLNPLKQFWFRLPMPFPPPDRARAGKLWRTICKRLEKTGTDCRIPLTEWTKPTPFRPAAKYALSLSRSGWTMLLLSRWPGILLNALKKNWIIRDRLKLLLSGKSVPLNMQGKNFRVLPFLLRGPKMQVLFIGDVVGRSGRNALAGVPSRFKVPVQLGSLHSQCRECSRRQRHHRKSGPGTA